ncbi:hypothetical protein TUSST3_62040 [Streptomyces sp. TUS-ST3]|nr:hypothetical protein TUSST3_62040 [Streptomyces sp. TUS-ST3]
MRTMPTQEATTAAGLKTGAVRAGASVEDMGMDVTGNIQAVKIRGQRGAWRQIWTGGPVIGLLV